MYFQLEVNETLANAMRAAAEVKAEIGKVIREEELRSENVLSLKDLYYTSDTIGGVISQIGDFMGMLLADKAFDEANKANNSNNEN